MTNVRILARFVALVATAVALAAAAQSPELPRAPGPAAAPPPAARSAAAGRVIPLDRVVAIVNDEALTQYELNEQKRTVLKQMSSQKVAPPPAEVLDKQLLDRLITERALLQFAKESGVRVDDTQVERTVLRIAQDNKLSIEDFRKVLEKEGISYAQYRERDPQRDHRPAAARARGRRTNHCQRRRGRRAAGDAEHADRGRGRVSPRAHPGHRAGPGLARADRRQAPARGGSIETGPRGRRIRAGGGGLFGRAGRAPGRRTRLAGAGAAADGVRRAGARDEARTRSRASCGRRPVSTSSSCWRRAAAIRRRSSSRRARDTFSSR